MTIKPLVPQSQTKRNTGADGDNTDHGNAAEQSSLCPPSAHTHRSAAIDVHSQTANRRSDLIDGIARRNCRSPHNKSRSKRRDLNDYLIKRDRSERENFSGNVAASSSAKSANAAATTVNRSLSPTAAAAAVLERQTNEFLAGIAACGSQNKATGSSLQSANAQNAQSTEEAYSGYNSGDEHKPTAARVTAEEWRERDEQFSKLVEKLGFELRTVEEDGACLFRAISLQIFGDEEMHFEIRQRTMDYISQNQEYYSQFVTEDIDKYIKRKRRKDSHGNHIEIQAMSEMYMRPIELYSYHHAEPMNVYNLGMHKNGCTPLRLSYQRSSHYNAILDPFNGTVGEGLGLPSYQPQLQTRDALHLSELDAIEKTMFEDKLKTTDWEATNEAMEEQIARESYLQWCRDTLNRRRAGTTSTVTSAEATENSSSLLQPVDTEKSATATAADADAEINADFKLGNVGNNCTNSSISNSSNTSALASLENELQKDASSNRATAETLASASHELLGPIPNNKKLRNVGRNIKKRRHEILVGIDSTEGTSSEHTPVKSPKQESPEENEHTDMSARASTPEPELPSTSKQITSSEKNANEDAAQKNKVQESASTFYQDLLAASYAGDGAGQLSESELLQRAIQMSTIDYIEEQKRKYLF